MLCFQNTFFSLIKFSMSSKLKWLRVLFASIFDPPSLILEFLMNSQSLEFFPLKSWCGMPMQHHQNKKIKTKNVKKFIFILSLHHKHCERSNGRPSFCTGEVIFHWDIRTFLTLQMSFYLSLNFPLWSKFPGRLRLLKSKYPGKSGLWSPNFPES
mgnify:CR=1 FL=1